MSAIDIVNAAYDATFVNRVTMIMYGTAQDVASEDPATEHHAERLNYAGLVILGNEKPMVVSMHIVSSNASIQATIESDPDARGSNVPDGDIEFALASIWTARSLA